MRKFFTALVVIPLGLIFIVFAVANRHFVTVSFDPFNSTDPSMSRHAAAVRPHYRCGHPGRDCGRLATWFRQRRWRRAARQYEADARQARAETEDLRAAAAASRADRRRLPAPSNGGLYGTGGRDKQTVTL